MDLFPTLGRVAGADIPNDRPIDGVDQTDFLLGKQESSNRFSRLVFYYGKFAAVRWHQYKFHFVTFAKKMSITRPSKDLGQVPEMYNLDTDPKEMFNLFGRSGGLALFEPMMRDIAPVLGSFRKFPNKDYSMMERSK